MRVLLQRVTRARVERPGESVSIGHGLVALVGVAAGDTMAQADRLADDIRRLRVFDDDDGRMDRSLTQVGGEVLVVPQITLYADTRHGRRPSFDAAAGPVVAEGLIERLAGELRGAGVAVSTGWFGARMQVSLVNDGPVTLLLET